MNVENTAPLDRIFHPHTKFLPKVTILENGTGPSSTRAPPSRSPSGRTSRPISSACPKNPARAAAAEVLRKLRSPLRPPPPSKKRIPRPPRSRHGCQMAIAGFLDQMCLFGPSGFWTMALLCYASKFDPVLSLDCATVEGGGAIPPPWRNPRKGRDHILLSGNLESRRRSGRWGWRSTWRTRRGKRRRKFSRGPKILQVLSTQMARKRKENCIEN